MAGRALRVARPAKGVTTTCLECADFDLRLRAFHLDHLGLFSSFFVGLILFSRGDPAPGCFGSEQRNAVAAPPSTSDSQGVSRQRRVSLTVTESRASVPPHETFFAGPARFSKKPASNTGSRRGVARPGSMGRPLRGLWAPGFLQGNSETPQPWSRAWRPGWRGSGGRVAGRTGIEPATSGVTGQCSNQLNYRPARHYGRWDI